ncbi:hypothetical protein BO71DRAFT_126893 [Aspergillus ellipticus CBS 707.79]|uniref:Uncharacterized protein n=1 Tax=Aspergillus ellipticus CBS 707.79 TaxID=1448320 RepID=A0A319CVZ0_9EURO|nr:hypothetical protein BO71DRAFT_126893 [Aspergillus ellipticus CBS 707.79]
MTKHTRPVPWTSPLFFFLLLLIPTGLGITLLLSDSHHWTLTGNIYTFINMYRTSMQTAIQILATILSSGLPRPHQHHHLHPLDPFKMESQTHTSHLPNRRHPRLPTPPRSSSSAGSPTPPRQQSPSRRSGWDRECVYIVAVFVVTMLVGVVVGGQAGRTRAWRALPGVDYLDVRMLVVGGSAGGE